MLHLESNLQDLRVLSDLYPEQSIMFPPKTDLVADAVKSSSHHWSHFFMVTL